MKELTLEEMQKIKAGVSKDASCFVAGIILGAAIGSGNALAAMGAVLFGYVNGCY
ncbi:hypothetical protein ABRY23_04610 [Melioribacteraceae bacterium 4301-Me]|uniref:hypothetical protein n=1 Tax=Pyranulibacter aquaticus TaxID=3163344 RepID=UPI003596D231